MIKKFHNHKLQTNPWIHEEEPQNINRNKTPDRQLKQSNQFSKILLNSKTAKSLNYLAIYITI